MQQIVLDEQKFKLADADQDGKLSLSEYAALTYPYHFDHMNVLDIERLKKQYDLDGNGQISKFEYLSYGIEERQDLEAQDFKDAQDALLEEFEPPDLDNNGVLDANEVKEWIAPGTVPRPLLSILCVPRYYFFHVTTRQTYARASCLSLNSHKRHVAYQLVVAFLLYFCLHLLHCIKVHIFVQSPA